MDSWPRETPGLEGLRVWFNDLAAIRWIGVECVDVEVGRVRALLHVREEHRNPGGAVNGGVLLAAADVTAGVAVSSTGEPGTAAATTDLTMHFLAAAVAAPLEVHAEILRRGRRSGVPHVRILDAEGTLCAVATGTWVVRGPATA
ncbi:PaaI family thioesterase [Nocardioides zeae]|uniref:PaaI family thioesterase n=1 Tax=Nocardioides imazamoxiresistens TaxID=3231893 RepID=A0ABU3PQZ1_9ACTN|nr:PaaI family thioesterase [Nocardioides zeae]MDT9591648.1 PaaI family thioesterase [Nocardioides zeae]